MKLYLIIILLLSGCSYPSGHILKRTYIPDHSNKDYAEKLCVDRGGLVSMECNLTGYGFFSRHCHALCQSGYVNFEQFDKNR